MNGPRFLVLLAMAGLSAVAMYAVLTLLTEPVTVPLRAAPPTGRDITDTVGDLENWLRTEGY